VGEQWRGWIQVWYIWYLVRRTCANATIYLHPAQQWKKRIEKEKIKLSSIFFWAHGMLQKLLAYQFSQCCYCKQK
jgi:hypothetical protein